MRSISVIALAFILVGCGQQSTTAEPNANQKLLTGAVVLIATAPDGTKLWAVEHGGRTRYFASSGVTYTESCGKNCTNEVMTPTVKKHQAVQ